MERSSCLVEDFKENVRRDGPLAYHLSRGSWSHGSWSQLDPLGDLTRSSFLFPLFLCLFLSFFLFFFGFKEEVAVASECLKSGSQWDGPGYWVRRDSLTAGTER